ncbi:MAG: RNA recognition motif domain-containing protein [Candidatus Dadabacteria bacterium]
MNIYISNLDSTIDDEQLKELFTPFGEVKTAEIVKDAFNGLSRGFGFVEMEDESAQNAIQQLNQTVVNSYPVTVQEAPETREQKGSYKVGNGAVKVYRFRKN